MAAEPPVILPPDGITLRTVSPSLLAAYPMGSLPPEAGGPVSPEPEPQTKIEYPPGYVAEEDPMFGEIVVAASMLSSLTCRDMGLGVGTPVPPELVPLAIWAFALYVEQITVLMKPSNRATAVTTGSGGLQSFTAGPYSESYFNPSDAKFAWNVLNPDPLLNSALLALITPECLANRQAAATGIFPPGYAVQEIDWDTSLPASSSYRRYLMPGEDTSYVP